MLGSKCQKSCHILSQRTRYSLSCVCQQLNLWVELFLILFVLQTMFQQMCFEGQNLSY